MKKILIFMGRYLPGHKDGGPLRTIVNLTDTLGNEYDFRIVCLDRDHGDTEQYADIAINKWNKVGKANVMYVKQGKLSFSLIRQLAKQANLVYICGFYDDYGYKTLILNRLGLLHKKQVVIASMGTFSQGALAHKSIKKKVFINGMKILGMFKNVSWSVTSKLEKQDVENNISAKAKCIIAEDLPRTNVSQKIKPKSEVLKVVFLSRICPKKNLDYAIKVLHKVKSNIEFTIIGPAEDEAYWKECENELKKLPCNVKWKYEGDVLSECVQEKLAENDVFLFPTKGENYGHVIFEALSVGCVPIISDQTPWERIAQQKCGYIFPLGNENGFSKIIDEIAAMNNEEYENMKKNSIALAQQKVEESRQNTGYRTVFGVG